MPTSLAIRRSPATALLVEGVAHYYGRHPALSDVSISVASGVVALVGVNGAGKSTLLRALAGAQRPTRGKILIGGDDPYAFRARRRALGRVSLMPQWAEFPRNLSAEEVVTSIGWLKGLSGAAARHRAREVIADVGLGERMRVPLSQLSGGMLRRVALAQALVSDPQVLLLDEPSTGLDPEQRRAMVNLVRTVSASVVMFSSHVLEDVQDVADRVIVLDEGAVVFDGTVSEMRSQGAPSESDVGLPGAAEAGFLAVLRAARVTRESS